MSTEEELPSPKAARPPIRVAAWLHALVEEGECPVALYDEMTRLAGSLLKDSHVDKRLEPADLAMSFILHLREHRKLEIETLKGLRVEMQRFLLRTTAPGVQELWSALSDALRRLGGKKKATRLDGSIEEPNGNSVRWCLPGYEAGPPVDAYAYEQSCKRLRTYQPAQRRDAQVIGPTEAEALVMALLKEAHAPITMSLLFSEARRHVVLMTEAISLDENSEEDRPSLRDQVAGPDAWTDCTVWLSMEVETRGDRAWRRIRSEQKGGDRVLCLYLLPARFFDYAVKLDDVGEVRRVSETNRAILAIIGEEAALERLDQESGDDFSNVRRALLGLLGEYFAKKCSEIGMDPHFNPNGTRREGHTSTQVAAS